jgi:5-formyltetrahydrofolate cyclo-ligase
LSWIATPLFFHHAMNSPKDLKRELRRAALARRDALDQFWRVEASLEMAEIAKERVAVAPGAIVSGFWPMCGR